MKTNISRITVLTVSVILASSCSLITGKSQGQNQKIYANPDLDPGAATIGTQNFLQVRASMERATGVQTFADTTVGNTYKTSVSQLSGDGGGTSVSAASLLATTTLASAYCNKAVASERANAAARVLFTAVDFAQGPAALSASVKSAVADTIAKRFWGRAPTATETAALVQLMSDTAAAVATTFKNGAGTNVTLNASQQVDAILLIACTAGGGSLDFVRS